MANFFNVMLHNVLSGPRTDPFPFGETFSPERIRGRVRIDPQLCIGCSMCRHVCVAGAINIHRFAEGWTITVWQDSCCLCASCRTYCPMHAITIDNDWHSAHLEEDKFKRIEQHTIHFVPCKRCGKPVRLLSLEKARELYCNDPNIDPDEIRQLCRDCRQKMDADAHSVCMLPLDAIYEAEARAEEEAKKAAAAAAARAAAEAEEAARKAAAEEAAKKAAEEAAREAAQTAARAAAEVEAKARAEEAAKAAEAASKAAADEAAKAAAEAAARADEAARKTAEEAAAKTAAEAAAKAAAEDAARAAAQAAALADTGSAAGKAADAAAAGEEAKAGDADKA